MITCECLSPAAPPTCRHNLTSISSLGDPRAGVCTTLVHITGAVMWDSIGSIAVGGLMGATAWFLISRNRQMLIGDHSVPFSILPRSGLAHTAACPSPPCTFNGLGNRHPDRCQTYHMPCTNSSEEHAFGVPLQCGASCSQMRSPTCPVLCCAALC